MYTGPLSSDDHPDFDYAGTLTLVSVTTDCDESIFNPAELEGQQTQYGVVLQSEEVWVFNAPDGEEGSWVNTSEEDFVNNTFSDGEVSSDLENIVDGFSIISNTTLQW